MANEVSIPVDASGFDRLLGTIEGTTKASKDFGETFKRALAGEVLLASLGRVASAIGGVEGKAISAAGQIAQGFFAAGPVGAALAATGAAVGFIADEFNRSAAAAKSARAALEQTWKIRRDIEAASERFGDEQAAERRARSGAEAQRLADAEEARQQRAVETQRSVTLALLAEADAALANEEASLARLAELNAAAAQDAADARQAAFLEELDIEADRAQQLRDQRDAAARAERERLEDDARYAVAVAEEENRQRLALEQQRADAVARIREAEAASAAALRQRIADDFAAIGEGALRGFSAEVGRAVGALVELDAAQIAAAASSKDFAQQTVASAIRAVSGVLQQVAQEATVKALLYGAEGLAALVTAPPAAPALFAASAGMAATAAAAGAGAIALNTAASGIAPARGADGATDRSTGGGFTAGGGTRTGPASSTVIVNAGFSLSTADEIGARVRAVQRQAERYGR